MSLQASADTLAGDYRPDAFMCERLRGFATRDELHTVGTRVSVIEERLGHMPTKAWVLGGVLVGALAVLTGTLSALWWITQKYLEPLLQAAQS